jgi:hypothetical protein
LAQVLTAGIDPHCADIAATQHDCGAITVAASKGARPAAAAVRVATSGVESVGAEEVGRTPRERRARGPRPRVHGRRHGRGGGEEGGEGSGEGEALT